jgi:hypothetical protein
MKTQAMMGMASKCTLQEEWVVLGCGKKMFWNGVRFKSILEVEFKYV